MIYKQSTLCAVSDSKLNERSVLNLSRQQEIEERLIEEETARRVEELVAKRVEEELEKRKDEIEREVLRRVEEAKRIMEKQLLEELERQRHAELAAQKAREVMSTGSKHTTINCGPIGQSCWSFVEIGPVSHHIHESSKYFSAYINVVINVIKIVTQKTCYLRVQMETKFIHCMNACCKTGLFQHETDFYFIIII